MPKFNQYLIENKKPVELVQELEKYEIKKSPLSVAARGKVINKSGSDYVSENKGDYGPGNSQSNSFSLFPPFPGSSNDDDWTGPSNHKMEHYFREQRRRDHDRAMNEAATFVVKTAAKAVAATALTTATGGLAPIIGGGAWIGGKWLESRNDEFLQFLGRTVGDIGGDMFSGGLFKNSTVGELARESGVNLKDLENYYEVKGGWKTFREVSDHKNHRDEGVEYRSDCELCRL